MTPFEVVFALLGGCSVLIQALGLWIISDLRDRVVRLESKMMEENWKMKAKLVLVLLVLTAMFFRPAGSFAQTAPATVTAPAATHSFDFTANAVALPGNSATLAGTEAGLTYQLGASSVFLRQDNLIFASGQFFGAGANFALPILTLSTSDSFRFYIPVVMGVDRLASGAEHWSALAGFGVRYKIGASGAWTFGGEIKYARLPGVTASGNTVVVEIGPTLSF